MITTIQMYGFVAAYCAIEVDGVCNLRHTTIYGNQNYVGQGGIIAIQPW